MSPRPNARAERSAQTGARAPAHAKRSFGQCFLVQPSVAERIAALATTPPAGLVVELGVGRGALTRPLLARASRVIGVERDRDLLPLLRRELAAPLADGKLVLLEADAKGLDLSPLLASGPTPRVLAGNIPYNITGPLLRLAIRHGAELDRVVFMVQKEVACRMAASAGSPEYGALSVFVQACFEVSQAMSVSAGCFHPRPRVESAVVELRPRAVPVSVEEPYFAALVRAAFHQRRKTLRNAWSASPSLPRDALARAAAEADIDLGLRGERLCVADFARMAARLQASAPDLALARERGVDVDSLPVGPP